MVQKNGHPSQKLDFITPTFMIVFDLFLRDPMGEYHEREVVRRTHVSKGSANKILRLLAELDLLEKQRKGRMVFYRLNIRDTVVRQFKILVNVYDLRKLLERIKENSRKVTLFGSSASGVDAKESDIDLFILTSEKELVRRKIIDFNRRNERKIAPILVNTNEFVKLKREDRALYENIDRGIVLWQTE